MNKKFSYILITLALALMVSGAFMHFGKAEAQRSVISIETSDGSDTSSATTTRLFVTTTATSTFAFVTENADLVELHFMAEASTTASVIRYTVQTSNNFVDWYDVHCSTDTAASQVFHENPCYYTWTPAKTATSTLSTTLTNLSSKYTRLRLNTAGANASVWVEASKKMPF